jgi:hypothetical protein
LFVARRFCSPVWNKLQIPLVKIRSRALLLCKWRRSFMNLNNLAMVTFLLTYETTTVSMHSDDFQRLRRASPPSPKIRISCSIYRARLIGEMQKPGSPLLIAAAIVPAVWSTSHPDGSARLTLRIVKVFAPTKLSRLRIFHRRNHRPVLDQQ